MTKPKQNKTLPKKINTNNIQKLKLVQLEQVMGGTISESLTITKGD